jgi:uncharacterized protein YkwD/putative cell wall-binding protein
LLGATNMTDTHEFASKFLVTPRFWRDLRLDSIPTSTMATSPPAGAPQEGEPPMIRRTRFTTGVLLVAVVAAGLTLSVPEPASATPQTDVASLTNAHRANAGLPALESESSLDAMAQEWAYHMDTIDSMEHSTNAWRTSKATPGWSLCCGENIAYGYRSASDVMSGWMNSPGHRANVLDGRYTHIGVGYSASGNFWVQVFATYPNSVSGPTPTISGGAQVGYTLTANPGSWSPGSVSFAYQWHGNGVPIPGATGKTYAVSKYDQGKAFTVTVTGTAPGHKRASQTSAATRTVPTTVPVQRVAGSTRISGAVDVSKRAYPGGADVVYVATAWNFPDAISASAAATHEGGPLLLSDTASVPDIVVDEVERLNPRSIVIVGGANSLSEAVRARLAAIAPTERLDGDSRYAVSSAIARSAFAAGASVAYVATGENFPDAVSASSAAASAAAPILLVPSQGAASSDLLETLRDLGVRNVRIAGGTASVSSALESSLRSSGFEVQRLAGVDRYAANQAINAAAFRSADHAFIATGENYPDALYGSAWAGSESDPLFLTQKDCVRRGVIDALGTMGVTSVTVLGGESSLSTSVSRLTACTT